MLTTKGFVTIAATVCAVAGLTVATHAAKPKSTAASSGPVVAQVGDHKITLADVDAKGMATRMDTYQQLYEARRAAADEIVTDLLIEAEAKSRGISKDQLVAQEVESKTVAVTDADVTAWYEANKARVGTQSFDQVKGQIQEFLQTQNRTTARDGFLAQLRAKTPVSIALDAPRVAVAIADDEPSHGPVNAPIQIVTYSEFQCPYCARVGPTVEQILEHYGERVRVVFRDFPLPMHQQARPAAEAAQCAHEQGKFWAYHDKLFANQRTLDNEALKRYAGELSLDVERFNQCFESGKYRDAVNRDHEEGMRLGVQGTPAFFVNGRFVSGARPFEYFQQLLDEELAAKGMAKPADKS
jgi:protein-disulfide isomerase